ncbi:hypothetical protein FHR81_001151 [Actinoalloteichus hoggarensis]|uniref:Uncharacterized protein n=1 Tax=Actinoalloteichus hoggarensis TaxID=1470176 RepID=A0A221VZE4_9PSEU|nr:hypothetical protein [Actinoalloteichus hoggarensis]ASO18886.1 hypothetical protein AHOG_06170 [Actinoalloteichus hoggarensis]MBB5920121.1 hypothetical protein [Actinoalloteichus hoggarensis]
MEPSGWALAALGVFLVARVVDIAAKDGLLGTRSTSDTPAGIRTVAVGGLRAARQAQGEHYKVMQAGQGVDAG